MSRIITRVLPDPPRHWDASSQDTWRRLTSLLENSNLFDKGRRTLPQFFVEGTVSAPLTLDVNAPSVTVLTHVVAKLLLALADNPKIDAR